MTPRDKECRFAALRNVGCLCCLMNRAAGRKETGLPVEIHHLTGGGQAGQKRVGDEATVPLCWHHHRSSWTAVAPPSGWKALQWLDEKAEVYGPGLAAHARRFRAVYGSDAHLLEVANALIA